MMRPPDEDYITNVVPITTREIILAAMNMVKWASISALGMAACALIYWTLDNWTPRAARWLDKDCVIVEDEG